MEVILLERVGRLGTVGDVVKVKNGYGRNFLLPQKKAMRATKESIAVFEAKRAEIEANNAKTRTEAEKKGAKLQNLAIKLIRQASEDGKLYGSVTVRDLQEALTEGGHNFDRKQIVLNATIKNTGVYEAKVVLHPEVSVDLKVSVVRNEAEVEAQVVQEELAGEPAAE